VVTHITYCVNGSLYPRVMIDLLNNRWPTSGERIGMALHTVNGLLREGYGRRSIGRVVLAYEDELGVAQRRELTWTPAVDREWKTMRLGMLFTITSGAEQHTYSWGGGEAVLHYPAGQDDIPEQSTPELVSELARAMGWFACNIEDFPECVTVDGVPLLAPN